MWGIIHHINIAVHDDGSTKLVCTEPYKLYYTRGARAVKYVVIAPENWQWVISTIIGGEREMFIRASKTEHYEQYQNNDYVDTARDSSKSAICIWMYSHSTHT